MINGGTKNIAITPIGYKELEKEETFVPYHMDLRNGRLSDAGNWKKRPGYAEKWDVGVDSPIDLLIPSGAGYAVTSDGRVFSLSTATPTEYTGARITGTYRPTYDFHNDMIIICDGGSPVKIEGGVTALLGGSPPNARFIGRISSYTILSGHDATEFKWCATGNPENWTTGDSGFANVQKTGEVIRNMQVQRQRIYFFKNRSIEVWVFIGGTAPFVRQDALWIDKGCGADYSVVQANDTFYWYGDDGDFYVLADNQPRVISKSYRKELDSITAPGSIYGYDFRKEGVVRWFAPLDNKCFVYDYVKGNFSEDNGWADGEWQRLPINSYMELNGNQYIGDYEATGKVYRWSTDYADDAGREIRVYRRFALVLSERGNRVKVNRVRFRFKSGVATATETSPYLFYRYRIDQGDWGNYEYVDMGSKGSRDPWHDFHKLGIGREIEFELVETDAVDYLLTHMDITARELGI